VRKAHLGRTNAPNLMMPALRLYVLQYSVSNKDSDSNSHSLPRRS
jgi:hypothetical protein